MKAEWKDYLLDHTTIDDISNQIRALLEELDEEQRNIHRICLALEEVMLRIKNTSEEPIPVRVLIGKKYGKHVFRLTYTGNAYDPTDTSKEESFLLENLGLMPSWGYRRGTNTISLIVFERAKRGRIFYILSAILLACFFGYLGKYLPDSVRTTVDEGFLSPIVDCFLGLLGTFSGIMIAMTISNGVLGVGDSSTLSRIGKKVIFRFMMKSLLTAAVVLVVVFPLFNLISGNDPVSNSFDIKEILKLFFSIIPSNPIEPFLTGNSLQIIVIGIFIGVGLLVLGEIVAPIRDFVQSGAALFQWLTSTVCSLVPLFVFAALLHQIWSGHTRELLSFWRPLLILVGVELLLVTINLLYAAIRLKCPPVLLFKKILPATIVGLTTASSVAAFSLGMENCEKKLGIQESYLNFAFPMGNVTFKLGMVAYLMILTVFFAESYGVAINPVWLITAVICCALLATAVPPIAGSGIMVITILFAQLNIPAEALFLAASLDIAADFLNTGASVALLQLELACCADTLHKVDHEVLTGTSQE